MPVLFVLDLELSRQVIGLKGSLAEEYISHELLVVLHDS